MTPASSKYGVLELGFEVDGDGKTILRHLHRRTPTIVQQALYFDERLPTMACVYRLSSGGPQQSGDRYSVEVQLAAESAAHISTGASTVIAPMDEGDSRCRQSITLEANAYLEWLPLPLIPCARSAYHSTTELIVDESATALLSEVVACGRLHRGERFAYRELSLSTVVCRPSGEVVARDGISLIPALSPPSHWSRLGDHTHFGSVLIVAPRDVTTTLYGLLPPLQTPTLRRSCSLLREGCGLSLRLTGHSSELLLGEIRTICSLVRLHTKGVPLQTEFPWR